MSIFKTHSVLKLTAIFMVVSMMAGAFATHSSLAKAAACGPTNHVSPVGTTGGVDTSCDVAFNAALPGVLMFTSDPNVTLSGGVAIGSTNAFSFGSAIADERGTAVGWQLQATSTGLTRANGAPGTPTDVVITGSTGTCTVPAAFIAPTITTCPSPPDFTTPVTLSSVAQTIVNEPTGTAPIYGDYTITSNGTYTIATGAAPGAYKGTITLTLLNAAA